MAMSFHIAVALVMIAVSACTTGELMGSLKEGMSPVEVKGILGNPNGQQRRGDLLRYEYSGRKFSGWSWSEIADFYTIFDDDKLVQWGAENPRQGQQPNIYTIVPIQPFPPVQ